MRNPTPAVGRRLAAVLLAVLLAGCGGDKEQERIDLLAADAGASFRSNCDVFLAQAAKASDWSVVGAWEAKAIPATKESVGASAYAEGCHQGLLTVTLADKAKQETRFRFAFVSVPTYGTWMLQEIGTIDAQGAVRTYVGNTDAFHTISANQGRHPDHPDYVGP